MIAIWRQLIWKECREQVCKMISLTAIVLAFEGYMFFSDLQAGLAQLGFGLLMCGVPGAFFLALGVAAGERTAGSLDFVRSFPSARWKWAAVRLAMGAVAALVQVVAAGVVMLLLAWMTRSTTGAARYLREGGISALCCLNMYGWTVAAGVRCSNELRAGVVAICLFVGWWVLSAIILGLFSVQPEWLMLPSPVGNVLFPDPDRPAQANLFTGWEVVAAQAAALVVTAWWFIRAYGELTAADNRSSAASGASLPLSLRLPRRSPLAAMVWKEYRESGPICLAGLVIVAALLIPPAIEMGGVQEQHLAITSRVIIVIGTMMALVLGVGGHAVDLEAGVWQFWRSRPIRPAAWFWLKYFTGAVLLVTAFDGALAALNLMVGGWSSLLRDVSWWTGPLVHLFAYSTAVWMVCQIRQPIYAGILSLGVVIGVLTLGDLPLDRPLLPWLSFSQIEKTCLKLEPSFPAVLHWLTTYYLRFAAPMLALSAVYALLGWSAARRGTPWSRITGAVPG